MKSPLADHDRRRRGTLGVHALQWIARGAAALSIALIVSGSAAVADPFVFVSDGPGPVNLELVFAVDLATGAVNPIPLGTDSVWSSAVSPSGKLQIVRQIAGNGDAGWDVAIIDTQAQRMVGTFPVREPAGGVAIGPRGPLAYATDCTAVGSGSGLLDVVDLGRGTVIDRIPLDIDPQDVRLTPEADRAYVLGDGYCTGTENDGVAVVDTMLRHAIAFVETPGRTHDLAMSPLGDHAYVVSSVFNQGEWLTIIDTRTDAAAENLPLPFRPVDVAVSSDGSMLYLLQEDYSTTSQVVFMDAASGAVIGTLPLPANSQLESLAVDPTGRALYVVLGAEPSIIEIDPHTRTIVRTLPLPGSGRIDFVGSCDGDCNGDAIVGVDELVRAVGVALGDASVLACAAADRSSDGTISVDELVTSVLRALDGCGPPPPTRTPTCTPTPTATPLEPGGCSSICDGRGCFPARCPNGDSVFGYCTGTRDGVCSCEPFECLGTCEVSVDPVVSPWLGTVQTITGSAQYFAPFQGQTVVTVSVWNGTDVVSAAAADGRFTVDVALHEGLNELTVNSHNNLFGPPGGCQSTTRRAMGGALLDICACAVAPCVCALTPTPTDTSTVTPTPTSTACNGECPTVTPTPSPAPTCNPPVSERPSPTVPE